MQLSEEQRKALEAAIRILNDGNHNAKMADALRPLLRAQADAQPFGWWYSDKTGEHFSKRGPDSYAPGDLSEYEVKVTPLYTNPKASAPGLSDADIKVLRTALHEYQYNCLKHDSRKGVSEENRKLLQGWARHAEELRRTLTRASAATVANTCEEPCGDMKCAVQCKKGATAAEPSEDAKRLEHIVAIGWEGLRKAWERFGEDHGCETALEEIRAVIDADRARPQAAQQQAEPNKGFTVEEVIADFERVHGAGSVRDYVPQQAEPWADERAAFEAWAKQEFGLRADGLTRRGDEYKYSAICDAWAAWQARAAQSGQRAGVAGDVIEAAAKKLAEDFDYPWEHMPAQGKDDFRAKVRSIAAMLATPTQKGGDHA